MKRQQRHQLKQNEFAVTVARVSTWVQDNQRRVVTGVTILAVVVIAVVGYFMWRNHRYDQASGMLGEALTIATAQIAPPPTVPGAQQAAGTYPTEQARDEAALGAFQKVAAAYPSTPAGLAGKYQAAAMLLALGRYDQAEAGFTDVVASGGKSIYVGAARMGLGEALAAQKKYDQAIKVYTDLAADRDGPMPVDGVLMQLARVSLKAGKTEEARAAFKRVVDEFPNSNYVAEARQQLTLIS